MRALLLITIAACLASAVPGVAVAAQEPSRATCIYLLQEAEERFRSAVHNADKAAARQQMQEAASQYGFLTGENAHPDLFRNCGNAYLLADDLPNAILAYRRGLGRYPLDAALWENLESARDQVAYPGGGGRHRPSGDGWPPFLPRATPNTVLYAALSLHVLAWAAATAWLMTRQRKIAISALTLFAAFLLMGTWWGYLQYRITDEKRQPLVVVAVNGVTLRRGNGSLYPRHPDLPQVNRGMEARLLNERGDWVQVQFSGGDVGWLPREVVLIDRPAQMFY